MAPAASSSTDTTARAAFIGSFPCTVATPSFYQRRRQRVPS
jgi:hypothetical protein